jgi:uncharacterized protein
MRWKGRRQSDNVEDRRGQVPKGAAVGGLGAIVLVLLVAMLGGDPSQVINQLNTGTGTTSEPRELTAEDRENEEFVRVVLADTEEVWRAIFRERGATYDEPRLVLFEGMVESACGTASSAVGPFYCSLDKSVYLDTSFFQELGSRFGAPGDFAQAYVIAHEVGHHVQNLLGTMERVNEARSRMSERQANELSVRLELQADFYAGVWAHHAQRMAGIDRQDIEEGIGAANAIGDDTLQRQAQGHVVPDSFTHGSSEQRVRWFLKGFETGDLRQGDTFSASRL